MPMTRHDTFANKLSRKSALAILSIGIAVSALVGVLALRGFSPLARIDDQFLDTFLAASTSARGANDTIVVDIDDVSLSAVGQWPWPRYRLASLVDRVAAARPAAIALDILLPEADRSSLGNIRQTLKNDFGVDVSFAGVPPGLLDNDGYLGHEMAISDVVGASYLYFDHASRDDAPFEPGLSFDGRTDLLALDVAPGVLVNADPIASQTRSTGFVNMLDDDGTLRRLPLLIAHAGAIHPSLAVAAVMRSLGTSKGTIEADAHGLVLRLGDHRVPIDRAGFATLRFNGGSQRFASVSALDILNGKVRPEALRGKIVFIGTSAVGLNDLHNTAVDARFPGLKIQSAMAENILQGDAVRQPAWAPRSTLVASVLAGLLMAAMFAVGNGIFPFVVGSALTAMAALTASVALYSLASLFVSPAAPIAVVALLFVVLFITRFAIEKRRARAWLRQLENARQITIESMASVAETRDPETGAHIKRTQNYVRAIAAELHRTGHYLDVLTPEFRELLFISAPLHDIGKVGVPDHILLKAGRLTPDEMEIMKQHAEFGRKIIFSTAQRIDGDNFLVIAGEIAATHHEKWDGTGYPLGLSGQAIPLSGRIMAVADIYDALISRRCYKEPFTHDHSTGLMKALRGKTFDPVVIDAFFRIEEKIKDIAEHFKDEQDGDHRMRPVLAAAGSVRIEETALG
jgi:HD-GYP domain-containing protein (c-di-GMP phosphodiesterase class II)